MPSSVSSSRSARIAPMLKRLTLLAATALLYSTANLTAQAPPPQNFTVHPDRTITFRYQDSLATKVTISLEGVAKPIPMVKDATGLWTYTTPPQKPEIYNYHFEVDGRLRLDEPSVRVTTNLVHLNNLLSVPGDTPQLWDAVDVPHGELHNHTFTTHTALNLPGNQDDYIVYTPPGYSPTVKKPYPVLYLLHGWGDGAPAWTAIGQAQFMFDNLLAQGKIKPMVVVMPLGYGDLTFIQQGFDIWNNPVPVQHNTTLFTNTFLTEILPRVESAYNVSRNRDERAIAGLSMGGLESLSTGLTNTDKFAWIGGFSSAIHNLDYPTQMATLDPKAANLRLLWIACGTEDGLITANRRFVTFLKMKKMPVTQVETPGLHVWLVWRDNLTNFVPLLFQPREQTK